jgi:hypothetical protein
MLFVMYDDKPSDGVETPWTFSYVKPFNDDAISRMYDRMGSAPVCRSVVIGGHVTVIEWSVKRSGLIIGSYMKVGSVCTKTPSPF